MTAMSQDDPPLQSYDPQEGPPLNTFYPDNWTWNKRDKSHEVRLHGENKTAHFHPNWSNGTAGVRGTRILNRGRYYWEINVSQRIFGTSMMFGIGTKRARLHTNVFVNMLGEDDQGWGLSHKGLLWHNGKFRQYAKPFRENEATTIGLLFDGIKAAKTEMTLGVTRRAFGNLQDQCRRVILKSLKSFGDVGELNLPTILKKYLADGPTDVMPRKDVAKYSPRHAYGLRSKSCGPHRKNSLKSFPYSEDNCKYYT
ncbi:hypothetical protein JTE90_025083 [Oedothorax gibbosus]|uniref:SPRY domain-containing SOCS box protein 3 n=1 Tax=Oedothorax gibbosus TaxID=931172 RepID=A0AAV6U736_9ARAC|nr:hypothetical protein JTE90_025083 [Oedothorax gibbosus]